MDRSRPCPRAQTDGRVRRVCCRGGVRRIRHTCRVCHVSRCSTRGI